jgi:formate dehydrogenase maturation protein FdhE
LSCPYCGMTDHRQLGSLVPEGNSSGRGVIETCESCLGYVKTFTRLQGGAPAATPLEDLASVALDLAAAEHGYKRPRGLGYAPERWFSRNGAQRH